MTTAPSCSTSCYVTSAAATRHCPAPNGRLPPEGATALPAPLGPLYPSKPRFAGWARSRRVDRKCGAALARARCSGRSDGSGGCEGRWRRRRRRCSSTGSFATAARARSAPSCRNTPALAVSPASSRKSLMIPVFLTAIPWMTAPPLSSQSSITPTPPQPKPALSTALGPPGPHDVLPGFPALPEQQLAGCRAQGRGEGSPGGALGSQPPPTAANAPQVPGTGQLPAGALAGHRGDNPADLCWLFRQLSRSWLAAPLLLERDAALQPRRLRVGTERPRRHRHPAPGAAGEHRTPPSRQGEDLVAPNGAGDAGTSRHGAGVPGVQGGLHRGRAGPAAALQPRLPQQLHRALARAARHVSGVQEEPQGGRFQPANPKRRRLGQPSAGEMDFLTLLEKVLQRSRRFQGRPSSRCALRIPPNPPSSRN